jgi:hypothetical protein
MSSANLLHSAIADAESGNRGRAEASLASLLMAKGVTIGMEYPGAMAGAVEHGIRVWRSRLEDCPFRFVTGSKADVKIKFVDAISSEGDVQGQIRVRRLFRWGSGGPSYRVEGAILVCRYVEGRALSQPEVAAVVEHELGHLLGLDDDERPGMLMGPFVAGEPVDGPSEQEVDKVADFRSAVRHTLYAISYPSYSRR